VQPVEARVHDREDEAPARSQQPRQPRGQRRDVGHIEQGHVAHRRVVLPFTQRQQRAQVGRIEHVIGDKPGMGGRAGASALDQRRREVKRGDVRPQVGQSQGVEAIAAGHVEHVLSRLQAEQPLRGRPDEQVDEVVARRAHIIVPVGGVGLPRPPHYIIR
jgi:hypothetical protein